MGYKSRTYVEASCDSCGSEEDLESKNIYHDGSDTADDVLEQHGWLIKVDENLDGCLYCPSCADPLKCV